MLLIDDRMGSDKLIAYMPPELCKRIRLEAGDVAFFGNGPDGPCTWPVGIEYKTAKEAMQCMIDGRLVGEQLPKMTGLYKRIYLVVEGEYNESSTGVLQFRTWHNKRPEWTSYNKVTYRQFDNWINSLTESVGVTVKRSVNRQESASQILNLYYLWSKPYDSHQSVLKFDKSHIPALVIKPTTKRLMFAQIPGVGWELSGRAESHFPTVYDGVNASEEQWDQISGIGKLKAKKIWSLLRS